MTETQRTFKPGAGFIAERRPGTNKWVGVLTFTSLELRGIADVLGPRDTGGDEMNELADWLDELNAPRRADSDDDDDH